MTKELNVKVLGTKFNFRNYDEDEEVTVNLLEGKVQLENYVKKMGIKNVKNTQPDRILIDRAFTRWYH